MSTLRGQGDRWLAGEPVDGVRLAHGTLVEVTSGPHTGRAGRVAFLMNLDPDPLFFVALLDGAGDVRARQSALRETE